MCILTPLNLPVIWRTFTHTISTYPPALFEEAGILTGGVPLLTLTDTYWHLLTLTDMKGHYLHIPVKSALSEEAGILTGGVPTFRSVTEQGSHRVGQDMGGQARRGLTVPGTLTWWLLQLNHWLWLTDWSWLSKAHCPLGQLVKLGKFKSLGKFKALASLKPWQV